VVNPDYKVIHRARLAANIDCTVVFNHSFQPRKYGYHIFTRFW